MQTNSRLSFSLALSLFITRLFVVVAMVDSFGSFCGVFKIKPAFKGPRGMAACGDELFVADFNNLRIVVLNRNTGALLRLFGLQGPQAGKFYLPYDLCVAGPHIVVSECDDDRVQVGGTDGELKKEQR